MNRFNIFGSPFSHRTGGHTGYSTHGKIPKQPWEWVHDQSAVDSFYMDHELNKVFNDNFSRKKYGLLLESKAIMNNPYEDLKENIYKYVEFFDAIFTHDESIVEMHEKVFWIPASGLWINDIKIHHKNKLVSMIASNKSMCPGHVERLKWVEKLKNSLDLYGRGFNPVEHKEEGLNNYMFSVAIENTTMNSHITEKIFDCFATGTIPIYLGPENVSKYFNSDGIIFLNNDFDIKSLTPELYYSKIDAIKDNFNRVQDYYTIEDYIAKKYSFVIKD